MRKANERSRTSLTGQVQASNPPVSSPKSAARRPSSPRKTLERAGPVRSIAEAGNGNLSMPVGACAAADPAATASRVASSGARISHSSLGLGLELAEPVLDHHDRARLVVVGAD